jgi:hypothetical protein
MSVMSPATRIGEPSAPPPMSGKDKFAAVSMLALLGLVIWAIAALSSSNSDDSAQSASESSSTASGHTLSKASCDDWLAESGVERADGAELMLTVLRKDDGGDRPDRTLAKQFADSVSAGCAVDGAGTLPLPGVANAAYQAEYSTYGP